MDICEHCHETDKKVIGCNVPLIHHEKWYRGFIGKCDICGKSVDATYTCVAYKKYVEKDDVCMSEVP